MSQKIIIEAQQLELIKEILKKYLPIDSKVWIFGSRVKEVIKKFSDLDLAIDANGVPMALDVLADLNEAFDESDLPFKVDIIDWNNTNENFKKIIKSQCVLLNI